MDTYYLREFSHEKKIADIYNRSRYFHVSYNVTYGQADGHFDLESSCYDNCCIRLNSKGVLIGGGGRGKGRLCHILKPTQELCQNKNNKTHLKRGFTVHFSYYILFIAFLIFLSLKILFCGQVYKIQILVKMKLI